MTFVALMISLCPSVIQPTHAATPYTPILTDPLSESYRWRIFPELNDRGLRCLDEDRDGNMWFGVDDGVIRYDGIEWKTFTSDDGLYGPPVNFLCTSKDGSLYTGTDLGISQFKDGTWNRIFPPEGDLPWFINDLLETSDGKLWAATEWGALYREGNTWHIYTSSDIAQTLKTLAPYVNPIVVPDEILPSHSWEQTTGVLIYIGAFLGIDRGDVLPVVALKAPNAPIKNVKIGDQVKNQSSGNFISRTIQQQEIDQFAIQPGNQKLEMATAPQPLAGAFRTFIIHDIYEDEEKRIWLSRLPNAHRTELFVLDKSKEPETWQTFTDDNGFESGHSPRTLQAHDNTIWQITAHAGFGVKRFDGKTWTQTNLRAEGGSDLSTSIVQTRDGTIWVASFGYLQAFKNNAWQVFRLSDLPRHRPRLLETSDGALWIAGLGGEAARFDFSQWITYKDLKFGGETSDGQQWFIHTDGGVVRHNGTTWTHYRTEDGLIETPMTLLVTKEDEVLVGGSHDSTAATAQFDGKRWKRQTFPALSWGIFSRGVYESHDGSVWFSAGIDRIPERGQVGGVLQYKDQKWIHHRPPSVPEAVYAFGQAPNNTLHFGIFRLYQFNGGKEAKPVDEVDTWVMSLWTDPGKALWVGTRLEGLHHFNGDTWYHYTVQDGLPDNLIRNIFRDKRGTLWIDTPKGISHFDGHTFTPSALSREITSQRQGNLKISRDGAIWANSLTVNWSRKSRPGAAATNQVGLRTTRYMPNTQPPDTKITLSLDEVSQPGNTTITWTGTDRWNTTPVDKLHYAYRLDDEEWSPFSTATQKTLLSLSSGDHTFAVKARDLDLNEDPTPTVIHFTVVPPVYQQAWFIALMAILLSAITFQTTRVIRRDRRLQEANDALSDANKELFKANVEIQQQSERKSTFLASMSHELRTPLNAIKGFTSLVLRREETLTDRNRENLEKATQASDHLLAMINDLLDLSKIEAGRMDVTPSTFNVETLIASCVSTLSPLVQDNVALHYNIQGNIGQAQTDEARVRQMLINLLSNAVKFTEKGEIRVDCTFKIDREIEMLEIAVSDTGKGIPKDELPTMFDEYRQVKGSTSTIQKGTGLGLSITRKFAELLGGTIQVESEEGKGSTFTVKIPVHYTKEG